MYFLRFTESPTQDLERGTSIHASDLSCSEFSAQDAAESFGCDVEDVVVIDGYYNQILDGICGFELEAETLDEAIEEAKEGDYQFSELGKPVIFSGTLSSETDLVPDGDLFYASKIEATTV